MDPIRILIIGKEHWVSTFKECSLKNANFAYTMEIISDYEKALDRLTRNSYDVLVLQDKFNSKNVLEMASMAYAMSKPSIIVCNNGLKILYYIIWKMFSKFTNKYKISRKMIHFIGFNCPEIYNYIEYLSLEHKKYFNAISDEINEVTKI